MSRRLLLSPQCLGQCSLKSYWESKEQTTKYLFFSKNHRVSALYIWTLKTCWPRARTELQFPLILVVCNEFWVSRHTLVGKPQFTVSTRQETNGLPGGEPPYQWAPCQGSTLVLSFIPNIGIMPIFIPSSCIAQMTKRLLLEARWLDVSWGKLWTQGNMDAAPHS